MTLITDQGQASTGQGTAAPGTGTGTGNQTPADWRAGLPEDLRSEKVFESIKGKDWSEAGPVLAKNYVNAQRMVGADKLVVPGEHATPEERDAFYNKLGRPETPDKYTYRLPEGLKPEQLNKPVLDKWLKTLHESGIPNKAAERIIGQYLAEEYTTRQQAEKAKADQERDWELKIKQEFGVKYDERLNYARFALKQFGDPHGELVKFLDETKLGSHPAIVKFFSEVGARMADDKARDGGTSQRFGQATSSADAQAQLDMFKRDPEKQKALFDDRDPRHADVVAERRRLYELAFPKKPENS